VADAAVIALGPLAVLPGRQRIGIGSALVRAGVEEADRRSERAVIVLGNPGYYGRFGFRPGSDLGLRNPFSGATPEGLEILEEHFMVLGLAKGGEGGQLEGEVRWHPAFHH
jgi:predicted N-acetyltransferase YhbS